VVGLPRGLVGLPRGLVGLPRGLVGLPRGLVGLPRGLVGLPTWHGKLTLWLGKLTLRLGGHTLKRGKPNPPINFSVKPQHEEALFKAVYRFTVENIKARADGVIELGLIQQNQQKSNSLSDWDGQSRPYRLGGPRLETEKLGKKKER